MRRPEQAIHLAICAHIRARAYPSVLWWHTPNEGKRGRVNSAMLKRMGMRAGVSDLIFVHRGKVYALELKAPGNYPTAAQHEFMADIDKAGGYHAWTNDLDLALRVLESWKLLRPAVG